MLELNQELDFPVIDELLAENKLTEIKEILAKLHPWQIAETITRQAEHAAVSTFKLLNQEVALEVFEELDVTTQEQILNSLRGEDFNNFVNCLDPDDRALMMEELPAKLAHKVLDGLTPKERGLTADLLGYPEGSVGRRMTPEFVWLKEDMSVDEATAKIKEVGKKAETVYTLPVINDNRVLVGMVNLQEIFLADGETFIFEIMHEEPAFSLATDSAEKAARLMKEENAVDLPIVDMANRLVGLLTFDDADSILEEAESEDSARQGGSNPWSGHYMNVSVLKMAKSRVVWLILLLAVSMLTVTVGYFFEDALETVAALAIFIPLLIGTGGKVGTQASSACVRALAIGEVSLKDTLRVALRELKVGLMLGVSLGIVSIIAGMIFTDFDVAFVVGVSLLIICVLSALVGGLSPLLAKKLKIDPALVSAPVVTTVIDVTGLIIYFMVAVLLLGI